MIVRTVVNVEHTLDYQIQLHLHRPDVELFGAELNAFYGFVGITTALARAILTRDIAYRTMISGATICGEVWGMRGVNTFSCGNETVGQQNDT